MKIIIMRLFYWKWFLSLSLPLCHPGHRAVERGIFYLVNVLVMIYCVGKLVDHSLISSWHLTRWVEMVKKGYLIYLFILGCIKFLMESYKHNIIKKYIFQKNICSLALLHTHFRIMCTGPVRILCRILLRGIST